MPEYKLIYFNFQGRAEIIRWIFAYSGIPFTDERIEWEDWPEKKADMPGGKLPILMIDTMPLMESLAIARYVAKEAGLVPENNIEAAYCDAAVDTFNNMMSKLWELMESTDDEEERQKLFEEEFLPNTFLPLIKRINGRIGTREWFIGDELTWADLAVVCCLSYLVEKHPDLLADFPAIAAHVEKVCELPAIKEWIANRPKTDR